MLSEISLRAVSRTVFYNPLILAWPIGVLKSSVLLRSYQLRLFIALSSFSLRSYSSNYSFKIVIFLFFRYPSCLFVFPYDPVVFSAIKLLNFSSSGVGGAGGSGEGMYISPCFVGINPIGYSRLIYVGSFLESYFCSSFIVKLSCFYAEESGGMFLNELDHF